MQPALLAMLTPDVELDSHVVLVDSPHFWECLEEFESTELFGCDIETFGEKGEIFDKENDDALNPWKGKIRLIQVALPISRKVLVIDLGGREYKPVLYPDRYRQFGLILLRKLGCPKTKVIGHNLKFDGRYLRVHLGATLRTLCDTMLMSQILWSGVGVSKAKKGESRTDRCKLPHTLKAVAERLGVGDLDKTEQRSDWGGTLTNKQLNYAANDALILLDIYIKLRQLLIEHNQQYPIYSEFLFLPVLIDMEVSGMPVDSERLEALIAEYTNAITYHTNIWYSEFPDIPHTATKKDLVPALNEKYQLEIEASNDEVLAPLAKDYPAIRALLDYRTLNISLKYLMGIKTNMFNGNIRSNYRQITGGWRTSSNKINLQNPPKLHPRFKQFNYGSVKSCFKPSVGYSFLVADLSAAHARIATQVTKCKALIDGYILGTDNHVKVAARVLQASGIKVTEEEALNLHKVYKAKKKAQQPTEDLENKVAEYRDYGKIGFYAYLNQAGAYTMQQTFAGWGISVTIEFCETLINVLAEIYPEIRKYVRDTLIPYANSFDIDFSHFKDINGKPLTGTYGVTYGLTGGRNYCLKQKNKHTGRFEVPYTDTISFTWLSSEANMLMEVAGRLYLLFLDNSQWEARICNYVHDELDIVCLQEHAETVANLVGEMIKQVLGRFITIIPVEEDNNYSAFIVEDWSKK
jgi:DNA polymerase I-like protein with 3'-5' exonuclease and polymerase domains